MLSNMVDFGMEPQAALDAPRFLLEGVDSAVGPASVRTSWYELRAPEPSLLASNVLIHSERFRSSSKALSSLLYTCPV